MALASLRQREHYRVPHVSPVVVETEDGRLLNGETINISMGGMCLVLKGEISRNIPGTVRLVHEEDGNAVEFIGRFSIAWTKKERPDIPYGQAGIQFVGLDIKNRGHLTRIIMSSLMKMEKNRQEGKPETIQEQENLQAANYLPQGS